MNVLVKGAKAGKNNRKHGRNARSPSIARYKAEMRWTKNKARKIKRHLKETNFQDLQADRAYQKLTGKSLCRFKGEDNG